MWGTPIAHAHGATAADARTRPPYRGVRRTPPERCAVRSTDPAHEPPGDAAGRSRGVCESGVAGWGTRPTCCRPKGYPVSSLWTPSGEHQPRDDDPRSGAGGDDMPFVESL